MVKIQYATISETTVQGTGHCPALPTFRAMANKKSAEILEVSIFLCTCPYAHRALSPGRAT